MIEIKNDEIIFNTKYFERLFIKNPIKSEKSLSSLSLRLAAILLKELDTLEKRKIPSRTKLAKILDVSNTAINDSLIQLEEAEFIVRKKIEEKKSRRFSDYFLLNYNYNLTKEELLEDTLMELKEMLLGEKSDFNNDINDDTEKLRKQINKIIENR